MIEITFSIPAERAETLVGLACGMGGTVKSWEPKGYDLISALEHNRAAMAQALTHVDLLIKKMCGEYK